jgi:hypothetical protein
VIDGCTYTDGQLLELARKGLNDCPEEGEGERHRWVWYAVNTLIDCGVSDEHIKAIVDEMLTRPQKPANEIQAALDSARARPTGQRERAPRWPERDEQAIAEIVNNEPMSLRELVARSPRKRSFGEPSQTDIYLAWLFPGNPLLCIDSPNDFEPGKTVKLTAWIESRVLPLRSLIVPSPMRARTGKTQCGKLSAKCNENTGPRKYLVIESDHGDLNQQSAVLWHLAQEMPLALVVFSGSESLHGWFSTHGQHDRLEEFFGYAVSLGADPIMWTVSQYCRLPDGKRPGGSSEALRGVGIHGVQDGRQACLYFDPSVITQ